MYRLVARSAAAAVRRTVVVQELSTATRSRSLFVNHSRQLCASSKMTGFDASSSSSSGSDSSDDDSDKEEEGEDNEMTAAELEFKNLLEEMGGLPGVNDLLDIRAHIADSNEPYQPAVEAGDLKRYFQVSKEDFEKAFPSGDHLGGELDTELQFVGGRSIMARDAARTVIESLQAVEEGKTEDMPLFYLDGTAKCGKSVALNHIILWARQRGWLVLSLPRAFELTHDGLHVRNADDFGEGEATERGFTHPTSEGTIHQPEVAAQCLSLFLAAHREQLRQLPAQRGYSSLHRAFYFGEEVEGEGEGMSVPAQGTLLQLVEAGVADVNIATSVFVDLRLELSLVTSMPVLLAVDQYNSLLRNTDFYLNDNLIWPEELAVVRAVSALHGPGAEGEDPLCPPLARGAVVGASSKKHPFPKLTRKQKHRVIPEVTERAQHLDVPAYNEDELRAAAMHYAYTNLLTYRPDSQELEFLKMMTSSRPGLLFRHCATYDHPFGLKVGPGKDADDKTVDLDMSLEEEGTANGSRGVSFNILEGQDAEMRDIDMDLPDRVKLW